MAATHGCWVIRLCGWTDAEHCLPSIAACLLSVLLPLRAGNVICALATALQLVAAPLATQGQAT